MTHSQTNLLPGPTTDLPRPRRFYYDNQLFEDPGPEYTPQDILSYLSHTYPELRNGSWTSRTLSDGSEEITFHKVTGEKGATVTVRQLLQALDTMPPHRLTALSLTRQIMALTQAETLTAETMLDLGPAIEAALKEAEQKSHAGQRITSQLLALPATPHFRVPLGF